MNLPKKKSLFEVYQTYNFKDYKTRVELRNQKSILDSEGMKQLADYLEEKDNESDSDCANRSIGWCRVCNYCKLYFKLQDAIKFLRGE